VFLIIVRIRTLKLLKSTGVPETYYSSLDLDTNNLGNGEVILKPYRVCLTVELASDVEVIFQMVRVYPPDRDCLCCFCCATTETGCVLTLKLIRVSKDIITSS